MGFVFDNTVNVGQVMTLVGFLGTALLMAANLKTGQDTLRARLDRMDVELQKQTNLLVEIAKQDERLRAAEQRLNRLENTNHGPQSKMTPNYR
jgi:Flp pilus assembly protein TadB